MRSTKHHFQFRNWFFIRSYGEYYLTPLWSDCGSLFKIRIPYERVSWGDDHNFSDVHTEESDKKKRIWLIIFKTKSETLFTFLKQFFGKKKVT